jgi:effector-binding domain-containing protein
MAHDASDLRIQVVAPQLTAAVRVREPMATVDVGRIFGEAMERLGERLGQAGAAPGGPPFARYHSWGGETADIEIGFPIAGPPAGMLDLIDVGQGQVGTSMLPGGEVAVIVHRGPYPTLGEAYRRLEAWIHEQSRQVGGAPWESYVDDPAGVEDHAMLRTEIVWPLAEAEA